MRLPSSHLSRSSQRPGKEWRCRCREWTCGHSGKGNEWDKWRKSHPHVYTTLCKMDGASWVVLVEKNPPAKAGDQRDSG